MSSSHPCGADGWRAPVSSQWTLLFCRSRSQINPFKLFASHVRGETACRELSRWLSYLRWFRGGLADNRAPPLRRASSGYTGCSTTAPVPYRKPWCTSAFHLQIETNKRADERTRTADLLITSARSVVAGRCIALQIPHKQRVSCSLDCSLLQRIASGLGSK
jgi:hypothetical protein